MLFTLKPQTSERFQRRYSLMEHFAYSLWQLSEMTHSFTVRFAWKNRKMAFIPSV